MWLSYRPFNHYCLFVELQKTCQRMRGCGSYVEILLPKASSIEPLVGTVHVSRKHDAICLSDSS